ncbi:MAG: phosphatase PAP2 family protein [Methanobacteriaceae archaeon]|nr:phosphatase PAP2 family protein [Methanobacteriaceae archaeon]MDP2837581.1 phosphatase PAP2 family protein [Methanobacteriaceae archaeon]MDP3035198.1 phosphatase PAP2 family protein [Methanobacteriaceae archaeon]MDP3623336.1 phosphatase PAP2 family protein [Methanobacteriaceae archaeon]
MFEAFWANLYHMDLNLFYFFNLHIHNPSLDVLMPLITMPGTHIFWIIICIGLYIFGGQKGKQTAFLCIIALFIAFFASEILKFILARPRPYEVLSGTRHLMDVMGYSLPSGHSTAAFAAFTVIGVKYGYLYIFLGLAIMVAISRIYMGLHYPSDVLAGALLGIFCSLIVLKYEGKLIRTKNKILNKNSQ